MREETKARDKILDYMRLSPRREFRTMVVASAIQCTKTHTSTMLGKLTNEGKIIRMKVGVYCLPDDKKPAPEGISGAQIGKAILDYVDHLKNEVSKYKIIHLEDTKKLRGYCGSEGRDNQEAE